jgi:hypothetical protein
LGDAARERRPPNAARTKHVLQTLDPAPFGRRFRGVDWEDVLRSDMSELFLSPSIM